MTTLTNRDKRFLKMCAKLNQRYHPYDRLAERAERAELLAAFAEDGKVAIVHGGMDCDCARWDDAVQILPASVIAVEQFVDRLHEEAEGPVWHHVETPSEAANLKRTSRDLALEAFEDGHPHSIHL